MTDIDFQIVNYKTKKFLPDCIDSIITNLKNSNISYKILVLENNSGDDLDYLKEKHKSEKVEFYYSDKNLGFGRGQNLLAEKDDGKYIFALNPDIIFYKGTVEVLFNFMEAHPEAAMCGPRVELPEKNFFFHKNIFWPKVFVLKNFFERFLRLKVFPNMKFTEYSPIIGSALFIRRKALEEVGGFDENLFLYFEEGDLCNSLKVAGYKIFFVYDAIIKHWYGKSGVPKHDKVEYFKQSRRYFYKKWFGEEKARKMLAKEEGDLNDRFLERNL